LRVRDGPAEVLPLPARPRRTARVASLLRVPAPAVPTHAPANCPSATLRAAQAVRPRSTKKQVLSEAFARGHYRRPWYPPFAKNAKDGAPTLLALSAAQKLGHPARTMWDIGPWFPALRQAQGRLLQRTHAWGAPSEVHRSLASLRMTNRIVFGLQLHDTSGLRKKSAPGRERTSGAKARMYFRGP